MNPFQNYTEKLVKSFDFKILRYVDFFLPIDFCNGLKIVLFDEQVSKPKLLNFRPKSIVCKKTTRISGG